MRTSYRDNNYGQLFTAIVKTYRPRTVVEFGCLDGYSTLGFLRGLEANGQPYSFKVFDLFEDYPYKHPKFQVIKKRFPKAKVLKGDYYAAAKMFEKESIDLLHIDISNTGQTYQVFLDQYYPLLKKGGVAILEGGSKERDNCDWMVKYKRPKIQAVLKKLKPRFSFIVVERYPSVTIFTK